MSTRSQIGFYEREDQGLSEPTALLYRHSDGYPEGVLPDILPFLAWWSKGRGLSDIEYASARLLQYLTNQYDQHSRNFAIEIGGKIESGLTGTTGYGISSVFHGDIEYYYAIYEKYIKVYDNVSDWSDGKNTLARARLILTLQYDELPEVINIDWVKGLLPKGE